MYKYKFASISLQTTAYTTQVVFIRYTQVSNKISFFIFSHASDLLFASLTFTKMAAATLSNKSVKYLVKISGSLQLFCWSWNRMLKNSQISGQLEPDIQYIPKCNIYSMTTIVPVFEMHHSVIITLLSFTTKLSRLQPADVRCLCTTGCEWFEWIKNKHITHGLL